MARRGDGDEISQALRAAAHAIDGDDYAPLLNAVTPETRLVLLGEASHGTHDFYAVRAAITQQLIEHHGFCAVIVEADWPDAYRVNRYVRGIDGDVDADGALGGFRRFPQWMWRNRDVVAFVEWMRSHNRGLPEGRRAAGFYGMDLYSLYTSIEEVLNYLERVDPAAAARARDRYGCFEDFEDDPQSYGRAAGFDLSHNCREEAIAQMLELQRLAAERAARDGKCHEDESFYAEQNAVLVKNAEEYYRQMFVGRLDTWNLRDTHMVDTIERLLAHLDRTCGSPTRAVVWAHNSHLGDATHTEAAERGEINVGSLSRGRWGGAVLNVGFTTHHGTVAAASRWGGTVERKRVRDSLVGSYERLLHDVGLPRFLLMMRGASPEVRDVLETPRLERAIGVIYRPETERYSHYFEATLAKQFDAVIHIDHTRALMPLEANAEFQAEQAETYPSGL